MYICMYTYMYIYMYIYIYTFMYVYMYIYIYTYIYIYVFGFLSWPQQAHPNWHLAIFAISKIGNVHTIEAQPKIKNVRTEMMPVHKVDAGSEHAWHRKHAYKH